MSYARFGAGGSDVYVFFSVHGGLECCGCILQERETVDDPDAFFGFYLKPVGEIIESTFTTTKDMLDHLQRHRDAGHTVLDETIEALDGDREENDHYMEHFDGHS